MSYEIGTALNGADLLLKLNTFLTAKGKAFGAVFTGTGNGIISAWDGGASSACETFTITATSSTSFSVVGSVSGNVGTATVGTQFSCPQITFMLTQGSTVFVVGDVFKINTASKWVSLRKGGAIKHYNSGFDTYRNVFDLNQTTAATMQKTSLPGWIGMQTIEPVEVRSFAYQGYNDGNLWPGALVLEWSDDGTTWTAHQTITTPFPPGTPAYAWKPFDVAPAAGAHAHWRVKITAGSAGATIQCCQLMFYTQTGGTGFNDHSIIVPWEAEASWRTTSNDGLRTIYLGAKCFWDDGADYFNWTLNNFTAWNPATYFYNQPGAMANPNVPYVTLWRQSIPYWFVANGQRVMSFARVSTNYTSAYLGFINAFISPGQWPNPILVGGNHARSGDGLPVGNSGLRYTYQGNEMHAFWRGYPYYLNGDTLCSGRLRDPSGRFVGLQCYGQDNPRTNAGCVPVWPWANNGNGMSNLGPNLDGSYPLIPTILSADNGNPTGTYVNTYGEFDGIRATTGHGNAAENTITEGFFTNVVWQDTFRTGKDCFCAFKLD